MSRGKIALTIAVVLILFPVVHAEVSRLDATFDIQSDESVTQSNMFVFDSPVSGPFNYTLDSSAKNIEAYSGSGRLNASLAGNVITIYTNVPIKDLTLKYTVSGIIFHLDSVDHFFTELSFDQPTNITAHVELPQGYTLYQNSFSPGGAQIISDGRRIILGWNLVSQDVLFSVKYSNIENDNTLLTIAGIVAALSVAIISYFYLRQKSGHKDDYLFGFRHDEKLVIKYLEGEKIILQRDLEEQFKFSRAKATRIVSKLVEKGLVSKKRYGRTNKLTWLR